MAISINKWVRNKKMELDEIVRFQILVQIHLDNIHITDAELDCLTLLGTYGEAELSGFCDEVTELKIFKSDQSTRNALSRMEKKGILKKEPLQEARKKKVYINPDYRIQNSGNILLDINCLYKQISNGA